MKRLLILNWVHVVVVTLVSLTIIATAGFAPAALTSLWLNAATGIGVIFLVSGLTIDAKLTAHERADRAEAVQRSAEIEQQSVRLLVWPECWDLLRFLFTSKVQVQLYIPAIGQLKKDYYVSLRYRGRAVRLWLNACFGFRTVLLTAECMYRVFTSTAGKVLLGMMPDAVQDWWREFRNRIDPS